MKLAGTYQFIASHLDDIQMTKPQDLKFDAHSPSDIQCLRIPSSASFDDAFIRFNHQITLSTSPKFNRAITDSIQNT